MVLFGKKSRYYEKSHKKWCCLEKFSFYMDFSLGIHLLCKKCLYLGQPCDKKALICNYVINQTTFYFIITLKFIRYCMVDYKIFSKKIHVIKENLVYHSFKKKCYYFNLEITCVN